MPGASQMVDDHRSREPRVPAVAAGSTWPPDQLRRLDGTPAAPTIGTVAMDAVHRRRPLARPLVRFEVNAGFGLRRYRQTWLHGRYYGTLWLAGLGGDWSKASVDPRPASSATEPDPRLFPAGSVPGGHGVHRRGPHPGTLSAGRLSDGIVAWTAAPPAGRSSSTGRSRRGLVYIVTSEGPGTRCAPTTFAAAPSSSAARRHRRPTRGGERSRLRPGRHAACTSRRD